MVSFEFVVCLHDNTIINNKIFTLCITHTQKEKEKEKEKECGKGKYTQHILAHCVRMIASPKNNK